MGRYYRTVDGIEYPSVTTVLGVIEKPALRQWAANCTADYIRKFKGMPVTDEMCDEAKTDFSRVSQGAMDIGTIVHNAVEEYLKYHHKVTLEDEEAIRCLDAFIEWHGKQEQFELISTERTVFNHKHHFAGTMDIKCRIKGKTYIIDVKTSKAVYDEYAMQLAAYASCEDMEDVEGIGVLRLDKAKGKAYFKDFTDEGVFHFLGFLSALDLYNRYKASGEHKMVRKEG